MNSLPSTLTSSRNSAEVTNSTNMHLLVVVGLWLFATLIATFLAAIQVDSALAGDTFIPRTNDSFYHARRILDALHSEAGIAQFDPRLNPPEGMVIPWPWGYDWMMVKLTELALWLRPDTDPMAFMSYVPVAWIAFNAALFLGAASAAGLSLPMRALAMLGFGLSPLVQLLHSVAMIDHHFVEFSFVLGATWLGIAWFRRPESRALAIGLALLLGAAPAFHIGLFLLQLIPLGTLAILWLRSDPPPQKSLIAFAVTLVLMTQLILLPSLTYQNGVFDYSLLSWFHFYVACCTAIATVAMGLCAYSQKRMILFAVGGLVLSAPLLMDVLQGAAFVTGNVSILSDIGEAQSPFRFDGGESLASSDGITYYSWLILLCPVILAWFGYRLLVESSPPRLCFSVAAVLGLMLLMLQFRFHYYGLFALIVGSLLIVDQIRTRRGWHPGIVFVTVFALIAVAYQPPLRERLFTVYAASSDPDYQYAMPILASLTESCARDPGLVLANHDDGNAILFHTDCSVIANNFILGAEDDAKFAEIARLMRSPMEQLLNDPADVKYLFVRANDFSRALGETPTLDNSSAIVRDLILADELPVGFELLQAVDGRSSPDAAPEPYARLYKLARSDELR